MKVVHLKVVPALHVKRTFSSEANDLSVSHKQSKMATHQMTYSASYAPELPDLARNESAPSLRPSYSRHADYFMPNHSLYIPPSSLLKTQGMFCSFNKNSP